MKVLVTGGAGFIGSGVVELLIERGHEAVVLDDLSSGYLQNMPESAALVRGDVCDQELVGGAADGCSVVFHLAASVGNRRSIEQPLEDSRVNLLGTLTVLEAARERGIDRVVFSSSAGIFGELKTMPIAEDHPQDPDSPYGVSKLAAEKACLAYNRLYGMRNISLRYFNVYGVRQRYDEYGNVIPIFAHRLMRGDDLVIFGDGEQTRDFVNVRDVAAANVAAGLSKAARGAFNLGSGSRISINELARIMIELSGAPSRIAHGPPRPGDVRDSLADTSAARAAFGFEPTVGLEEGLVEYLQWLSKDPLSRRGPDGADAPEGP